MSVGIVIVIDILLEGETDYRPVIPPVETGGCTVMESVENLGPVVELHDDFRWERE